MAPHMGGSEKIYHCQYDQHAKEVVSDNLGLVDFAIGLVNSVLNLPDGQVIFLGGNSNYRRNVINPAQSIFSRPVDFQASTF